MVSVDDSRLVNTEEHSQAHSVLIAIINEYISNVDTDESDRDDDSMAMSDELRLNPVLHQVIPDPHELMQLLHHAGTYGSNSCFFIVGNSDTAVMAIYRVWFPSELAESCIRICDRFYSDDLKVFCEPDDEVPALPQKWNDAFESPQLGYLKMDEESWNYTISIWRVLNIDLCARRQKLQTKYPFPLPVIACIVPFVISFWNSLKGGGDTITKLLDRCKERNVGIRSETIVATAPLFLYFGVLFHRIHQWCGARKDLDFYASVENARDANNKQATFACSLTLLCELLISQSRRASVKSTSVGLDSEQSQTIHYIEALALPTNDNNNVVTQQTR
jgi:hypothetical protein